MLQDDGIVHGVHGLQSFRHQALCLTSLKLAQCLQSALELVPAAAFSLA